MEVKIKPKQNGIVRDPISKQALAPEGELKELTNFWQRRLNDGDVILCDQSKPEPKKDLKKD